ncbi:MAG: sugar kinase [Verrucomicrobia bacterium]|nr:sugar kinase [Verrucomicrobiota bacterium]
MSVLIVGSTALDSIKTPRTRKPRLLGGSASHAALAASLFAPVRLVGVVGTDFPRRYLQLYRRHRIDLEGLQIRDGKTFHWSGQYEVNMDHRRTLRTELGVFETFSPDLPPAYRHTPWVLLANIAPSLQIHVLNQMTRPRFVAADTMDLWLNIARDDLNALIPRLDLFVLNESEAQQLTRKTNVFQAAQSLHRLGPRYVIIKKGQHGAVLSGPRGLFLAPAYPLPSVVDPTGAGDSFLGGLMGCLAQARGPVESNLRRAVICGTAVASFCCEGFGLSRTLRLRRPQLEQRVRELRHLTRF